MKIAIAHGAFIEATATENLEKISRMITGAAKEGGKLLITPEMAVQGYVWRKKNLPEDYMPLDDLRLRHISILAAQYEIDVLLCGSFLEDGKPRNGCLHIDSLGKQRALCSKVKTIRHFTEDWAVAGEQLVQTEIDGHKVGLMICADAWYDTYGYLHKQAGAEALIIMAAWPGGCGGPPELAWCRNNYITDLPVIVCNQTGCTKDFDCTKAKSAYVWENELRFSYSGEEALLFTRLFEDEIPSAWENFSSHDI